MSEGQRSSFERYIHFFTIKFNAFISSHHSTESNDGEWNCDRQLNADSRRHLLSKMSQWPYYSDITQ